MRWAAGGLLAALLVLAGAAAASHLAGPTATYTLNNDFNEGTKVNVDTIVPHQLQLPPAQTKPFPFIWIAVSTKGTVVKVDTLTGAILGEYLTSPNGLARDPSRTTVDQAGNVWVTNRAEASVLNGQPSGSITHLGLVENDGCVDRNNNGVIDTSTGFGDVRPWTNAGGANTAGGVSTAADECVIHFVRTKSTANRHVSVDKNNNVWVSGTGERSFQLIHGSTGAILRTENSVGCGGYGGLIDKNNVIWSARPFLRWNTANPLTAGNYSCLSHDSYGMCLDSKGNLWETALSGNVLRKWSPAGALLGTFAHGNNYAQGCAVDRNDHVWVAHSLLGPQNTVGHVRPDGTWVGNVVVGSGPTGVSIDAAGKVWVTNYNSGTATRIDPAAGPIGADGATRVGQADLTTAHFGGLPYNYSDMTGSANVVFIVKSGVWTVTHDSTVENARWGKVRWNGLVPAGAGLSVTVQSSQDGATFSSPIGVGNGQCFSAPDGRYLRVAVKFTRGLNNATPILYDLSISVLPISKVRATALWAGTAEPASVEYETRGVRLANAGSGLERLALADVPAAGAYADAMEERGSAAADCDNGSASAYTQTAEVRLLSGQVVLEALVQSATVSYNAATGASSVQSESYVAKVFVAGRQVNAEPVTGPTTIALPGGGFLALFERALVQGPLGVSFRENIVHLYVASSLAPYGRHEVIVGGLQVQAGLVRFEEPKPLILLDDDARKGRDAGSTPAGAILLTPGLYDGSAPPGDAADYYAVDLQHGEKVSFVLDPAARAKLHGGYVQVTPGTPPPVVPPTVIAPTLDGPGLERYMLRLLDPGLVERERADVSLAGAPQRLELNTDKTGRWFIEVVRVQGASASRAHNYSMALAVTPVPLLPQRDALGPGDAPDACHPSGAGMPQVGTGVWPGVVRDADFMDVYKFDAQIGEAIVLALKPGEDADGVDMALHLWDRNCGLIQTASTSLDGVARAKGVAETVIRLPSQYSGRYFVGIQRVNGVGNHYLALSVVNPMPTLPNNDAGTGGDAPTSWTTAPGVTPANAVFQGRLEEGDAGDAYRLPFQAGRRVALAFTLSAGSTASVTLYAPGGAVIASAQAVGPGSTTVFNFVAPSTGTYGLEVKATNGGGNYMVGFAQGPV